MHVEERMKTMLAWLLALTLVVALGGLAACTSSSDDESTDTETSDASDDESGDEGDESSEDTAEDEGSTSDPSDAELEDGAIAISKAYFGQFGAVESSEMDFSVAVMVKDSEGNWWARVTAVPNDSSMETEQIYVKLEPGNTVWFVIDMGTGIDPATDEIYPEDVGAELQP